MSERIKTRRRETATAVKELASLEIQTALQMAWHRHNSSNVGLRKFFTENTSNLIESAKPKKTTIELGTPYASLYSKEIGSKNANIHTLMEQVKGLDARVPVAFAIPSNIYDDFIDNNGRLPDSAKKKITESYISLCRKIAKDKGLEFQFFPVAVRSSGVLQKDNGTFLEGAEDSVDNAFAGLNETLLNVTGIEPLIEAIEYVMNKCGNQAARSYMESKGINPDYAKLPVVIQEMVIPESVKDSAGIIYSQSKTNPEEMIIEEIIGGNEYCVGGIANRNIYIIDRKTLQIKEVIKNEQKRMLLRNPFATSLKDSNLDISLPDRMKKRFNILQAGLDLSLEQNVEIIISNSEDLEKSNLEKITEKERTELVRELFEKEVLRACLVKAKNITSQDLNKIAKNLLANQASIMEYSYQLVDMNTTKATLPEEYIIDLAKTALEFEQKNGYPADIEAIFKSNIKEAHDTNIVQIRPLTGNMDNITDYGPERTKEVIAKGLSASQGVVCGKAQFITEANMHEYKQGYLPIFDIADTLYTWLELMAEGAGARGGGINGHAAIIGTEISAMRPDTGFPYIVGLPEDMQKYVKDGDEITIDTWTDRPGGAVIMKGRDEVRLNAWLEYKKNAFIRERNSIKKPNGQNLRLGLINSITEGSQNAVEKGFDSLTLQRMENLYREYGVDPSYEIKNGNRDKLLNFLFEKLKLVVDAFGILGLPVTLRGMDFQGPDMKMLLHNQDNQDPAGAIIGQRGAYMLNEVRPEILDLEADLILMLVEYAKSKGMDPNIKYMIPFVRDEQDVEQTFSRFENKGIVSGKNGINLGIMAEVASNSNISRFINVKSKRTNERYISFVSIGGNDGAQSWQGAYRNDSTLTQRYSPISEIVKEDFITPIIKTCKENGIYVSFCGNAAGKYPEFASYLYEQGIDEIGVSPEGLEATHKALKNAENELLQNKKIEWFWKK
jgi:phosphoenolpyruvate synthase/pyruvate phosphate dikinase